MAMEQVVDDSVIDQLTGGAFVRLQAARLV